MTKITPPDSKVTRAAFQCYTAGALTFNSTTWANAPTLSALTIAAAVGDILEAHIDLRANNENVNLFFDAVTEVGGTPTNSFGTGGAALTSTTGNGVGGLTAIAAQAVNITGSIFYTVQAGDISSGNVTVRLRYRTASATNRTATAASDAGIHWAVKKVSPL